MKKSLLLLATALLLPFGSAWAGSTTYKATLTVGFATNTGSGKIYASKDSATPSAGDYVSSGTKTSEAISGDQGGSVSAYAFQIPADGNAFGGWSTTQDGKTLIAGSSSGDKFQYPIKCSSSDNQTQDTKIYAVFNPKPERTLTFEKVGDGTYTVTQNGTTDNNPTSVKTRYTVTLNAMNATGYKFVRWYYKSGEEKITLSSSATYSQAFDADTAIGVEFMEKGNPYKVGATRYETLAKAIAALPSGGVITMVEDAELEATTTLPVNVTLVVPSDATMTVPSGSTLTVNGTVALAGGLSVGGAVEGSGKVVKTTRLLVQGDPITPANAHTSYETYAFNGKTASAKHCDTTVTTTSPIISGTPSCTVGFGVLLNGTTAYVTGVESPKVLCVTFDTETAVNKISAINSAQTTADITANGSYVLAADTTMKGPTTTEDSKYTRINFVGTVDCAGFKCTVSGNQVGRTFRAVVLNGSFEYNQSYWQCGQVVFFNCVSVKVTYIKYSVDNIFYFYDCGTAKAPTSVTFGYYSEGSFGLVSNSETSSSSNKRDACFYSGYFSYAFSSNNDSANGKSTVYGGSFQSDPSNYIVNTDYEAKQEGGFYVVKEKTIVEDADIIQIGSAKYKTLSAAVAAAADGAKLEVISPVTLKEDVTIGSAKRLTIDMRGYDIAGGSIINEGKLRLEDGTTNEKGEFSTPVTNRGNGTIDITYGKYLGSFTVSGGTLTTHGGDFPSTFSVTKSGSGAVHLKGGTFAGNVTSLLEPGYRKAGNNMVGEVFHAQFTKDSPAIGSAEISYEVLPLPTADYNRMLKCKRDKKALRSDYTDDAEWDRLAELLSAITPYEGGYVECQLKFDRLVKAGTVTGYGSVDGYAAQTLQITSDLAAGAAFGVLKTVLDKLGSSMISYKYFLDGSHSDMHAGVKNNSLDNIGTTFTLNMVAGSLDLGSASYKFSGKGAIAGSTDHTSLQAAVNAVVDGATVRLSLDCSAAVTVSAMKTFILDNNNFVFSGSLAAGTGYKLAETTDLGGGKTRYRVIALHTVTVPAVARATVEVRVGDTVVGTEAGDYTVDHGQSVTVIYRAQKGYGPATTVRTIPSVTGPATIDTTGIVITRGLAVLIM